jgi:hypothetical protein
MAGAVTNGSFHSQRLEALGGIACRHHHTAHTITALPRTRASMRLALRAVRPVINCLRQILKRRVTVEGQRIGRFPPMGILRIGKILPIVLRVPPP